MMRLSLTLPALALAAIVVGCAPQPIAHEPLTPEQSVAMVRADSLLAQEGGGTAYFFADE